MPDATTTSAGGLGQNGGTSASTLSSWAGPYVTNMLAQTQAVAAQPYALYGGQMTAGPSALQNQAFQGIAGLTLPSNVSNYQTGDFNAYNGVGDTSSYMNPYVNSVLDPQLDEMRRQADISRVNDASRLTGQGALGGSRQAILEAEGERNLGQQVQNATGTAYSNAYDNAQANRYKDAQLNLQDQQAGEQSRQFGAGLGLQAGQFGLSSLNQMMQAGQTQRDISQQGLTSDYSEFVNQRDYPKQQLQFEQSMLNGLPISTVTNTPTGQSGSQQLAGGLSSLAAIMKTLGIS